jgi:hypothetical protein
VALGLTYDGLSLCHCSMSCNVDVAFVGGAMMEPPSPARSFFLLALSAFLPCATAAFVAAFAVGFLGLPIRMGVRGPDVVGDGGGEGVVVVVGHDNGVGPLGLSGRQG